jgi:hypothetical protein
VRSDASVQADTATDVADAGKLPPGAEAALATNHRVFCRSFQKCFPAHFKNQYGDEEGCVSRRVKLASSVLFGPGSHLTTADIEACGAASGSEYSCDEILRIYYENPVIPAACRLKGDLDNGTPCAGSDQCKSGYCRYEVSSTCGKCADRVGPGGPCQLDTHCAEGFACDVSKCVAWVDRGGVCGAGKPCHVADTCASDSKCVQRLSLMSACEKQDCEISASCNTTSKICEPIKIFGLGQQCGYRDDGTYGLCDWGLKCKIDTGAKGACVGAAKLGEPCFRNGPNGSQCEAPLMCATTCVLPSTDTCR